MTLSTSASSSVASLRTSSSSTIVSMGSASSPCLRSSSLTMSQSSSCKLSQIEEGGKYEKRRQQQKKKRVVMGSGLCMAFIVLSAVAGIWHFCCSSNLDASTLFIDSRLRSLRRIQQSLREAVDINLANDQRTADATTKTTSKYENSNRNDLHHIPHQHQHQYGSHPLPPRTRSSRSQKQRGHAQQRQQAAAQDAAHLHHHGLNQRFGHGRTQEKEMIDEYIADLKHYEKDAARREQEYQEQIKQQIEQDMILHKPPKLVQPAPHQPPIHGRG